MVAACIKAETGVGPSIASGSQVCKPNCADLPTAAISKKKLISVIIEISNKKKFKFICSNLFSKIYKIIL
jgi:hypothetical protein